MAKLSMSPTELFVFYILIVVHRLKFNSFIITLIIIKIELSTAWNNENSNFLIWVNWKMMVYLMILDYIGNEQFSCHAE